MFVLGLTFLLVVLDQATKFLVHSRFVLGEGIPVIPGLFDIRYVRNTGAAFGMMEGMSPWLVVLSVVMLVLLTTCRRHFLEDRPIHRLVLALLLTGILGNLVDRVKFGYVIDFLYFYWRTHDFPAFNLADSCICIGVGLYLLTQVMPKATPAPGTHAVGSQDVPGPAA